MDARSRHATGIVAILFVATLVLPGIVLATPLADRESGSAGGQVALAAVSCPIDYPTFPDATGLTLLGSAAVVPPMLRVTPATANVDGQAWAMSRVETVHGFTTDFTIQFTGRAGASDPDGPGGDGLAFVIQDSSADAIGAGGGSIGYGLIPNSLAVELDTFNNGADNGDPDGNHVAIHSRGEDPNGPEADSQLDVQGLGPAIDLQDGAPHQVRVSYTPGGPLEVFVDDLVTAAVSAAVDLPTFLGLDEGSAWVGFTAATGGAYETHDVLAWTFCETNLPPVVDAGADVTADEGAPVTLDATATDPEAAALTYAWSATPGPGVDPGAACTFADPVALDTTVSCTDDGSFTLSLSVSDGVNPAVVDTTTLSLTNVAPTVELTSPLEGALVELGVSVALSATVADAGANDSHTCSIDWADGTVEAGTLAAGLCTGAHAYTASGTHAISVTVTDDDTGSGTDSVTITVPEAVNLPPVVDAGADVTADEGAPVTLDATATDPEAAALTYAWSATPGPGVDPGAACTFADPVALDTTVSCTDDGSFTLSLSVSDGVNPAVVDTTTLSLTNVAPTVELTSPLEGALVELGVSVALSATVADAGANDSHTCSIDWADGTVEAGTLAAGLCTGAHAYTASGTHAISVTVTDDDTGSGTDSVTITVPEAEPDACTHRGTEGDDTLTGTSGNDVMCGLGGNDTLVGMAGGDLFIPGDGNDRIRGGGGIDTVSYAAAAGPVVVNLASGNVTGASGADDVSNVENVIGTEFDDRLVGDNVANALWGSAGADRILGNGDADLLDGGADADTIRGGGGSDHLLGGPSPTVETVDRLFGDGGGRDVCEDGPGLPDLRDSCERATQPTEVGAGEDGGQASIVLAASRRTLISERGPARWA